MTTMNIQISNNNNNENNFCSNSSSSISISNRNPTHFEPMSIITTSTNDISSIVRSSIGNPDQLESSPQDFIPKNNNMSNTNNMSSSTIGALCSPKTKFSLTIILITSSSFLIAFILICTSIVLGIGEALLDWEDVEGEIYALIIAISLLFMGIGVITLVVGVRMFRGKYLVNEEGFVVNSKGQRINVLGDVSKLDADLVLINQEMERSPIMVKPFNFSNV